MCTGFLALAAVVTALPTTLVHAESKKYWTGSKELVGIVEKVMNDGSIGSTFNEGHLTVEGEDAYCIDINTDFRNGYKTRADASTRISADQISDVALSIEYGLYVSDQHTIPSLVSRKLKRRCINYGTHGTYIFDIKLQIESATIKKGDIVVINNGFIKAKKSVEQSIVDAAVVYEILQINDECISRGAGSAVIVMNAKDDSTEKLKCIEKEISSLEKKLTDMYRDDKISKEAYDDKYSEIGNKLEKKSIYFLTAYYHRRIMQIR